MRALVAATSAALVVALVGVPAQAAAPVPRAAVALPAALDRAAFYEPQAVCDPTPRPGVTALKELLVTTYGPATIYIPRACTSSTSEHFDGRALDWMRSVRVPAEKEMADAFVAWLLAPAADGTPHAMARRLGIMYVIWNSRMIRMYDPGRGWTEYKDCLDPARSGTGLDNTCHRNHVHLSLSWDGAAGITSWWTGVAQTQPYCPRGSTSATPGAGQPQVVAAGADVPGVVAVPPTVILDTRAGAGAGLTEPCRLLAGRSLHPRAAVAGLVPPGAAAAVLQVTSVSNAPAKLVAWSSGAPRPAGQVATPIGSTLATMVVPIASDATVGLSTTLGASNIVARLVGYVTDPELSRPPGPPAPPAAERPSKPRSVKARSARTVVRTSWKKPARTGGSPVTGYRVEALVSKRKGARVAGSCTAPPTARSCRIEGLKQGQKYWMSVSVTNVAGTTWAPRKKVRVR
jgi:hypothetical protein